MLLLKSLFGADTALRFRFKADPRMWAWSLRFLANCTAARNRANTLVKVKLNIYSREALIALRRETGIARARLRDLPRHVVDVVLQTLDVRRSDR